MRTLGIDGGIASIGWGLLEVDYQTGSLTVTAAGVRTFDAPELSKERTPTSAVRRLHRSQRRVIRRRRQRMNHIRNLFHETGLLPTASSDALAQKGFDPWHLRVQALERPLTGTELAVVLGHIAAHRGFKSNAKRDAVANASDENSKMKKAILATNDRLQGYRTVGDMFANDPAFQQRKRNRGDFSRSILRTDQEYEVRRIFADQRRFGNALASEALEHDFTRITFFQRPLQDSEHMVRACPFERTEKRTARRSYAFEMFRLLSRLATMSLTAGGGDRRLLAKEIMRVADDFGRSKRITYKAVRKVLDLDNRTRFTGISENDEKNDVVARHGNAAEGTHALREIVGVDGWRSLMHQPVLRDRISEVLTFRDDPVSIQKGLEEASLQPSLLQAIMAGVHSGHFSQFTQAGHISSKAARALLPSLQQGKVYSEACEEVGYDHAARVETHLDDVRNPVARKAVCEMLKQIRAIVQAHGLPDAIHIEMARDIGKSAEERDKIKRGIDDRNNQRDRIRKEIEGVLGRRVNAEELLRYELWKEQNNRCLYTDDRIPVEWLDSADNRVQVDHILPWSRFGDDSFMNKALCTAKANQDKRDRTPFEWFASEGKDWARFVLQVEGCKTMKGRKKGAFYLRKNAKEVEETFRNRNLGDTRYATRLLLDLVSRRYPDVDVRARPGQLTAKLRRSWGLEDLKKDADGKRLESDQHHALDAIIVAATTEGMLQKLTKAAQEAERQGLPRGFDFTQATPPATGFREVVRDTVQRVFVSRAEKRRVSGEAHAATIKRVLDVDGVATVFERKAVEKLTVADLDRIPVPEAYGKISDPGKLRDQMVSALRSWIDAGKPKHAPPRSPKGDIIRKVRVRSDDKVAVCVRGGTADRGDMARVDVFSKLEQGKKRYYLVPIYPHQIVDRTGYPAPPSHAVVANTPEPAWKVIDATFNFRFSLYGNSLIEVVKPDGEVITGYFKGLNRTTGAISVAPHHNSRLIRSGIGTKTLAEFRKLSIDRLGQVTGIRREVRTWHGEACT